MATGEQRRQLLGVTCPWCHASPGEECSVGQGKNRSAITTLDGGSHDARWRAAFGDGAAASVITTAVEQRAPLRVSAPVDPEREPVAVGAALPAMERPW